MVNAKTSIPKELSKNYDNIESTQTPSCNWVKMKLWIHISLNKDFAPFIEVSFTWLKKAFANPIQGFENDGSNVSENERKITEVHECAKWNLMLGQVANYATTVFSNTIAKKSK